MLDGIIQVDAVGIIMYLMLVSVLYLFMRDFLESNDYYKDIYGGGNYVCTHCQIKITNQQ